MPAAPAQPDPPEAPPVPFLTGDAVVLDGFAAQVAAVESIATTRLELRFHNGGALPSEAVARVPLPPGATLVAFNLTINGLVLEGAVEERGAARERYEQAKARGEDAVLLERADDEGLVLSLHVPAGGQRVLRAAYVEHLALEGGARVYRLPTSGLAARATPVDDVDVVLTVRSAAGILGFVTPGLPLTVAERSESFLRAHGHFDGSADADDLVATWTEGGGAWVPALVAADAPGAEGSDWTSLLATVTLRPVEAAATLPRDMVFVLDTSGSMAGTKIEQARESLREVLLTLRPDDRFGLVRFASEVQVLTPELQPATTQTVSAARRDLAAVGAEGSTDFDGGLQAALRLLRSGGGRVPVVVVLSDGLPTQGVTDPRAIVQRMLAANGAGATVHVLAIGLDADGTFLEDVAAKSGGSLLVIAPDANLQRALAGFYERLEDPLLLDVRVDVAGVPLGEMLPEVLPPLYRDGAVRILFRADLTAVERVTVTLSGISAEGPVGQSFAFGPGDIGLAPEVHRLWGAQKVASLLSAERMEGSTEESRDAIINVATTFGVVTPYTSWVIARPEPTARGPAASADEEAEAEPGVAYESGELQDSAADLDSRVAQLNSATADADGDGYPDDVEARRGTDPSDPRDAPGKPRAKASPSPSWGIAAAGLLALALLRGRRRGPSPVSR